MKKISESRLATLIREEVKLMNLEIAGVENWEGYKEALYPSKPNESEAYYADYLNMSDEERLSIFKELALKEKLAALKEDLAAFKPIIRNILNEEIPSRPIININEAEKIYNKNKN